MVLCLFIILCSSRYLWSSLCHSQLPPFVCCFGHSLQWYKNLRCGIISIPFICHKYCKLFKYQLSRPFANHSHHWSLQFSPSRLLECSIRILAYGFIFEAVLLKCQTPSTLRDIFSCPTNHRWHVACYRASQHVQRLIPDDRSMFRVTCCGRPNMYINNVYPVPTWTLYMMVTYVLHVMSACPVYRSLNKQINYLLLWSRSPSHRHICATLSCQTLNDTRAPTTFSRASWFCIFLN